VSRRGWAIFAAVSVLWGIPYLLIKIAVDQGVPPVFVAWARVVIAASVLLGLGWKAGVLTGLRRPLPWLAFFALSEITIPFPLIASGERRVASSLTAILVAATPLIAALLALRFDHSERVEGRRLAGLVIGIAGVVALVGVDIRGRPGELLGAGQILAAAICYAIGPLVLKRHLTSLDPRASMGVSLGLAAIFLTPLAALDPPAGMPSPSAAGAILGLGLLCTAAAFVLYVVLIAEVGATRSLVITYINPVVAVLLGMAVLGERPGPAAFAGLALILAGSWLSTMPARSSTQSS
jgi:drug/metabolite transporter (DMT)-like permease